MALSTLKTKEIRQNQYLGKQSYTAVWATALQQHGGNHLLKNILFKLLQIMYLESIAVNLGVTESWRSQELQGSWKASLLWVGLI